MGQIIRSGDKLKYIADVHQDYTGKLAVAEEFYLEGRMVSLKFENGMKLWVFWDEVELVR